MDGLSREEKRKETRKKEKQWRGKKERSLLTLENREKKIGRERERDGES